MDRQTHLEWAKQRALAILERGDLPGAFDSLVSDCHKHRELKDHPALELGTMERMCGFLGTPGAMRRWIEGFA